MVWVRRERAADELIGDVWTVEVGRVNVVDPERDRLAQHGERGVDVARRTPDVRASELHGAIAHAIYGYIGAG